MNVSKKHKGIPPMLKTETDSCSRLYLLLWNRLAVWIVALQWTASSHWLSLRGEKQSAPHQLAVVFENVTWQFIERQFFARQFIERQFVDRQFIETPVYRTDSSSNRQFFEPTVYRSTVYRTVSLSKRMFIEFFEILYQHFKWTYAMRP